MKRYTEADAIAVGTRCKAARVAAELSQRQAATGLPACTAAYLSRVEAGDRMPSLTVLRLLGERYGVSPRWLETGRDVVEVELPRVLAARLREHLAGPQLLDLGPSLDRVDLADALAAAVEHVTVPA